MNEQDKVGIKDARTHAPLKIMHLANDVREAGNGIINVMIDLACIQAAAGHDVTVGSAGGAYESLLAKYGVRHIYFYQAPKPAKIPSMLLAFNRIVSREKPDVVHAHMVSGLVIAKWARFGRRYRIVCTVHNEFQKAAKLMGWADRVVAVGKAVAASMARRGVPSERIRTIANGTIGSPRRAPRDPVPGAVAVPELQRPSIVTVAGMYHRKGIGVLIKAVAKLDATVPKAHLYLVGDGPDRKEFEALAATLGVADRVHFMGFQSDAPAFLRQADVFTLASLRDPFPLAVIEAREAGCAIVASDVDGIPEALNFGKAGLLVPPDNVDALSDALKTMLVDDVAREGWKSRVKDNLDWMNVARVSDDYVAVYEEVVGRA